MRIHHVQVMIPAGREDEARAFYGDLLELAPIARPAEMGRPGLWFRCGDQEVHLGIESTFTPPDTRAHTAFLVSNLDQLRTRLEHADLEVKDAPALSGRRRFHAWDPFGNRLEFLETPARP